MNLKHLFVEYLIQNLKEIESLKEEIDLSNPDLTDAKKQMYWAMLSACLCFEWIKKFELEIEQKLLQDVGFDFNALYETLLKSKDLFNLGSAIVRDFTSKISDIKHFFTTP